MQSKTLSILAAVAVTVTAAAEDVQSVEVIHILETLHVKTPSLHLTPNKRDVAEIFRRADMAECSRSAVSFLRSAPTPDPRLEDWALTATETGSDPCSLIVPSSLSEPFMEYMTEVNKWANEKEADAEQLIQDCDLDVDDANLDDSCSTPGTLFFTSANKTKTVPLDTILATMAPTAVPEDNAAAPRGAGMAAAVFAALGVAGAVMAL
ncbi:hypothetical protein FZEAL_5760 [Fusarium zealandicum]|uniref:Infection structure specific protein n=1 Tax=Fusarium zealandicum TaxID=1053134 RepID=A0A8H4UJV8_9HYPO|nr:hypothetical protein FZEAL_5760 [Fusarium zealandicum]